MAARFQRRTLLRFGLAAGAGLAVPAARACEFFAPNLRVFHPWTWASLEGADEAVVCMTIDEVTKADRLVGAATPVAAGAEIGGLGASKRLDFPIPEGRETLFSEGGTYLRLVGLQHRLEGARSYPLDLVFARGGMVRATLTIDLRPFG